MSKKSPKGETSAKRTNYDTQGEDSQRLKAKDRFVGSGNFNNVLKKEHSINLHRQGSITRGRNQSKNSATGL